MKLPVRQLGRHLEQGLAGCYLIAAEEPLQVGEAAAAVRQAARRAGFDEREVFTVDRSFRWDSVAAGADSLSLFASRRIVELRLPTPRPGDAGARVIRELAGSADPDRLVLITIDAKLDAAAQKSVWLKAVETDGVVVDIRPVGREELPQWIQSRARGHGLKFTHGAAELMADRVEGNLLAADQEIAKLALVAGDREIDEAAVLRQVGSSSRFDVFRLGDAVLAGDARRALTVLDGLRSAGTHPTLIAWALIRELALLSRLDGARRRGDALDAAFGRLRVWRSRQGLVRRALGRYRGRELARLMRQARDVDLAIKGAGAAWPALTALVLAALEPRSRWLAG